MFAGMVGWHALIVVGVVLMFAVIVVAVVIAAMALTRRRRGEARAVMAAGWYPDLADRGMQRYWDGTRWTEHTDAAPPRPDARGV